METPCHMLQIDRQWFTPHNSLSYLIKTQKAKFKNATNKSNEARSDILLLTDSSAAEFKGRKVHDTVTDCAVTG